MESEGIAELLPHGPSMQLVDKVISCSPDKIHCQSVNHNSPEHPLKEAGRLPAMALVEYGAQAAAIHAAICQTGVGGPGEGYIGAIKDLELNCQRLESIEGPIDLYADCELASVNGAIYRFSAQASGSCLATGRLTLIQP